MRRALVADLHLGQSLGDEPRFQHLLAQLPEAGVRELILGGDVFRTLVGFPRFWDEAIRACLHGLKQVRERGVRVVWVEGNRDFFLDSPPMAWYHDRFVPAYGFVAGARRFVVEHGDMVNAKDVRYRFWRALSKSRPARFLARSLPPFLARAIVLRTEAALANKGFRYRFALPEEALARHARRHFAAGVDVVLWGHFHRRWSFLEAGKEAHVVPPWLETGCVVYIEEDGSIRWPDRVAQFVDNAGAFCYQEEAR